MKIAFFDTKQYDKASFEAHAEKSNLEIKFFETKLNEDTVKLAKGYDAVCVFVNDVVNEEVINALYSYNVKLIALRCAGFNNVDLKAAQNKIAVVRVPAYSPYAVAEHTMALILTSVRRIHKAFIRTKSFNFSLSDLAGFDLYQKTVGVIGTGKIGKIFINICNGFGMNVIAYDKYPDTSLNVKYVELDELFRKSDIISLHCPLTDSTYHIIDSNAIDQMKQGVLIVNTSRGALIDSSALLDGIKSRKVGGACLDVYEEESDFFFEDYSSHIVEDDTLARLISMPNVIVTSHQAFLTNEALENIAQTTIDNINEFFSTNSCKNQVSLH